MAKKNYFQGNSTMYIRFCLDLFENDHKNEPNYCELEIFTTWSLFSKIYFILHTHENPQSK